MKALANTTISRTGYDFVSWNTKADGTGTDYAPSAIYSGVISDVTLYAKWKAQNYTLSYNANGGTGSDSETITYPSSTHTLKSLASTGIARVGYDFLGWNSNNTGTGTNYNVGGTITGLTNQTVYANWQAQVYTLTYTANSGVGSGSDSITYPTTSFSVKSPEALGISKDQYVFLGWNTKADGTGTNFTPSSSYSGISSNVALYAKWQVEKYYLTYESNGGKGYQTVNTHYTSPSFTIKSDSDVGVSRDGYDFIGWNTQKDGKGTNYNVGSTLNNVTEDTVLYAKWTPGNYYLPFCQ
jgi:uncharacterized repeat protein (TIGR02543 family)